MKYFIDDTKKKDDKTKLETYLENLCLKKSF